MTSVSSNVNRDGRVQVGVDDGHYDGDSVRPYLVPGAGPGFGFDELVSLDPRERYVAVREGPCLSVIDTRSGDVLTLSNPDPRDDGVYGQHRAATFSPDGTRMAYLRGGGAPETVVVRELRTGAETEYRCPEHLIFETRFDAAGEWLVFDVTDADDLPRFQSS